MARALACRSSRQNPPPTGKDEPAGPAATEGSDTYAPAPAVSRASTLALPAAPSLASAAVDSMIRYLEADLQRILRIILETKPPAPAPQPLFFPDGSCERPLKARFPELFCDMTQMECYNFIQQCKDYFATAGTKGPNQVLFAATFLREQALFRWQQHKAKNAGKTNVPLTQEEFKTFLCRSLRESQVFVDSIWRTIRKDYQYQLKEVIDWAAHIEHLQTVLKEFNPVAAPTEEVLICYFCDGLRPSIRAQTNKRVQDLDTWEEAIKKTIDAEAKAACQPQSLRKEMDNRCPQCHWPTKTDEPAREPSDTDNNSFRPQESKTQALQRSENADTSEKAWKEKKKNDQRNKRDRRAQEGSTLATGINTKTSGGDNSKRKNRPDPVQITGWNCNQKGHYSSK